MRKHRYMNKKRLTLILALPAMLLLQNCIKEKENVIPEIPKVTEHWGYERPKAGAVLAGVAQVYTSRL